MNPGLWWSSPDRWVVLCRAILALNLFATVNGWFALANLLEVILVSVVFSVASIRKTIPGLSDVRVLLLLAFIGWIAIATFWGEATLGDRLEEVLSWRKIILFPIALALFKDKASKLFALKIFCFWAFLYALSSWAIFLLEFEFTDPAYLLENDVVQTIIFSFAALCIIIMLVHGDLPANTHGWTIILIVLISNVFVVATGRSGYLFLTVGALVIIWYTASGHRIKLTAGFLILTSVAFSLSDRPAQTISQGISEIKTYNDSEADFSSMGIRLVMWENTIRMIQSAPILGTGSGSYKLGYEKLVADKINWRFKSTDDPHNQYLHLWAEQGFPAVLFLLGFLCVCLFTAPSGAFGVIAVVLIAGISATSIFNGHFSTFVEGRLFWLMLGVCIAGQNIPIRVRELLSKQRFLPEK